MNGGGRVTLDGTATDAEDDTLTYAWTSSGGGTFDDATVLDTTWTAPAKTDAAQDIVLTLNRHRQWYRAAHARGRGARHGAGKPEADRLGVP